MYLCILSHTENSDVFRVEHDRLATRLTFQSGNCAIASGQCTYRPRAADLYSTCAGELANFITCDAHELAKASNLRKSCMLVYSHYILCMLMS